MPNKWLQHLSAYWKKNKSKGGSYKQAMKDAKKTYTKVSKKKKR